MQYVSIIVGLMGGLAIFLFGLDQMTLTLKVLAGKRMKSVLASLTANRFTGVLTGVFVTSVIQSSSVTSVLLIGFVSAGLISLPQAISVIMGAEIGTTITAQIVTLKFSNAGLLLIAVGFAMRFFGTRERTRQFGTLCFGFGLLFFGIQLMSEATGPLRESQAFRDAVKGLDHPLLGILVAAGFTAIIQSSSATTVLIIVLAGQGLITLTQAIPLVFGANIGTCVTALLASIGKRRDAVRVALAHVTFNVLGVALWFNFMGIMSWLVENLSSDVGRQIANTHTIFNLVNTLVFIWFIGPISSLVKLILPDRPDYSVDAGLPRYLDRAQLHTPELAIESARREIERLGKAAANMVRVAIHTALAGRRIELERLESMDDTVDSLHAAIVTFLGSLSRENLTGDQSQRIHRLLLAANYLENIGDTVESNLILVGRQRIDEGLRVSNQTIGMMESLHSEICWALENAIAAFVEVDVAVAQKVIERKAEINKLIDQTEAHLSHRLSADAPDRLVAFRLESEIMEYLKRIYYFAKRIAKLTTEDATLNPPAEKELMSPDSASTTSDKVTT